MKNVYWESFKKSGKIADYLLSKMDEDERIQNNGNSSEEH